MTNLSDEERYDKEHRSEANENRLICSGALGVPVVAVIQLLQVSSFDRPLLFSLFCFAVSIPLMAMSVYVITVGIDNKNPLQDRLSKIYRRLFMFGTLIGLFATAGGLLALFFHFGSYAEYVGWVFLSMCIVATVFGIKLANRLGNT